MCGICGFVKFDTTVSGNDSSIIRRMNRKLIHRGPDAQDVLLFDNVAFGFSRLSIVGLENGMQPIFNEDKSIILICNGEIFNYIELKDELRKRGHIFTTSSDVEVIIHLYEEFGESFLNKLNGQFAFALFDKNRKELFCARDQMGIIPFFYTVVQNTFIFGSEIKAILEHPLVIPRVDVVGLDQIFTFAGLISPRTMFEGIHSLENGHYILLKSNGHIVKTEYWDLIYSEGSIDDVGQPEQYYIDTLEEFLEQSIKLRLRADVPSGFYLSGGLDSSMIAMKVSKLAQGKKYAFSIDFVDSQLSEAVFQKLVATQCNSNLNQKVFFYDDISNRLKDSIYHSECPIKETYNTASLCLSEAVKKKGIKVVLSGEGADELFAGYVGYRFDKMRMMGEGFISPSGSEASLRNKVWGDTDFFYERDFSDFNQLKQSLYSQDIVSSFDAVNCLNFPVINKDRISNRSILKKRAYIDYKLRLVDHLISDHGDRMAMANSIEVRYPFLDKNLVEFSARIPDSLKLNDFTEKYILKMMAKKFVPHSIVNREKFGFVAPGSPYLIQKDIPYVNDILSYDLIKRQGYFNPDKIEALKKTYKQDGFAINTTFESDLLITVLTFGIFLENFFD